MQDKDNPVTRKIIRKYLRYKLYYYGIHMAASRYAQLKFYLFLLYLRLFIRLMFGCT